MSNMILRERRNTMIGVLFYDNGAREPIDFSRGMNCSEVLDGIYLIGV